MKKSLKSDKVSVIFMQLGLLFTVCLIAANIFETKEIVVGPISLTEGLAYQQDISYGIFDVFKR